MRRREFIGLLGGAMAAWPFAPGAAQGDRMRRVGMLLAGAAQDPEYASWMSAFTDELQKMGWREGNNIRIDVRWTSGDPSRLPVSAAEFAALEPELFFCAGTPPTMAMRRAAPAHPIVFVNVTDPVATGLVETFARPGGRITGFTNFEFTLGGKWLATLKEAAPDVTRVAVLFNPENAALRGVVKAVESAATALECIRWPLPYAASMRSNAASNLWHLSPAPDCWCSKISSPFPVET
jgi:putative ABC transport system substrate-binding protein